jgi:hypothetical protein
VGAQVRAVPVDERLVDAEHDYADAFEVRVDEPDDRSAEEWVRAGLEQAPPALRRVIFVAHRRILRLRLGPRWAPDHMLGWTVVTSTPEAVQLTASGPLIRGILVGRVADPRRFVLTTCVDYQRPAARWVWRLVQPVHRGVARYLMAYSARRSTRDHPTVTPA